MGAYPDPEFMVEQMGTTDPSWKAQLNFMVPFPGKLGAATESAESMAAAAKISLDLTARDLAQAIRESAAETAYMQKAIEVAGKNRALLKRLSALSLNAYAARSAELIDLVRANSMVAKVDFDDTVLKELLDVEKARLNSRLARETAAPLGTIQLPAPLALAYSIDEVGKLVAERPEEMHLAGAEIQRAKADARAARLEAYPDFTFGAFKNPVEKGNENSYGFSVGITLPIWGGKNSGRNGVAEAGVKKAEAMREAKRLSIRADARELYFRVTNAARLTALYNDTLIPQSARSLQLAENWMKGGEASLSDYTEIATTLYGFELARARAEADHAKYLARLESLAGQPLTSRLDAGKEGQK